MAPVGGGLRGQALDGTPLFCLKLSSETCEPRHEWYLGCYFGEETSRGLEDREDRLFAALFRAKLQVGASVTLVATTDANALLDGETTAAGRANHDMKLFTAWQEKHEALAAEAPSWL